MREAVNELISISVEKLLLIFEQMFLTGKYISISICGNLDLKWNQ